MTVFGEFWDVGEGGEPQAARAQNARERSGACAAFK